MLVIRKDQMHALSDNLLSKFISSLALALRTKLGHYEWTEDVRWEKTVADWVNDARKWGLQQDSNISKYVEICAGSQRHRADLETRLRMYLSLYHGEQSSETEIQNAVKATIALAAEMNVQEEEGIAWLALIVLCAPSKADQGWMRSLLGNREINEEQRLLNVHFEAISRGWLPSKKIFK